MQKVFARKQVIALFLILAVLAVFLWVMFFSPPGKILNSYLKFFQAGLLSQPESIAVFQEDFLEKDMSQDFKTEELSEDNKFLDKEDDQPLEPPAKSIQDQLDDIAEKLDIIQAQIQDLIKEQEIETKENLEAELEIENEEDKKDNEKQQEESKDENKEEAKKIQKKQSSSSVVYAKILISEVQISSETDEKQEFVELYNPNNEAIDLTGWYLQKKTAGGSNWSTFASKNLFDGKSISQNGYFLIARTGYYLDSADIFTDSSITDDNSFALKNPNGDISDKLGFGSAQDPELLPAVSPGMDQSIGRKVFEDGSERDTDINFSDFELQTPTPKSQNITYVEPPAPEEPGSGTGSNDIFLPPEIKLVIINEIQIAPIEQRFIEFYNPNNYIVDLTGWYLQRKTQSASSWGSLVSSTNFEGKSISPNDYFIISRQLLDSDILLNITLSENNSLILKDLNRNVIDKVGWGDAQDFEITPTQNPSANQSIGRKWDDFLQIYMDANDNSSDFEIQQPTPKSQNITWVEPPDTGSNDVFIAP